MKIDEAIKRMQRIAVQSIKDNSIKIVKELFKE